MKRLLILNVLLLAIIVGLMVQIISLWWGAEAEIETVAPREAKAARSELPPAARNPAPPDLATNIAEHDLFDASRAAEKVTPVAQQAAPPPALDLILLGVTLAGGGREALFRDQTQPKPVWLREGEEHKGFKINRIDPRSVVLLSPSGDEITLMINVERKAGAPPTGPAGVQLTITPAVPSTPRPRTTPQRVTTTPAPDIREKIERLREEARRRRQRPQQPPPEQ